MTSSISGVQRQLDQYVQRQLRVENSGASYADTRAQLYQQLQDIYGQPGGANSLETVYNNFTNALQALTTSPDDPTARSAVVSSAQLLSQQLNQMTDQHPGFARRRRARDFGRGQQGQRGDEPDRRAQSEDRRLHQNDSSTATLMDQRDNYIDQLSQLMDINVVQTDHNQVSIFTNSGVQLVGSASLAAQLRRARHHDRVRAVERRPDEAWRRHHHDHLAERHIRSI